MAIASLYFFFFFQAEDGIRDVAVTGVQTCALPISGHPRDRVRLGAPPPGACPGAGAAGGSAGLGGGGDARRGGDGFVVGEAPAGGGRGGFPRGGRGKRGEPQPPINKGAPRTGKDTA